MIILKQQATSLKAMVKLAIATTSMLISVGYAAQNQRKTSKFRFMPIKLIIICSTNTSPIEIELL